jgi:hypothetical protein
MYYLPRIQRVEYTGIAFWKKKSDKFTQETNKRTMAKSKASAPRRSAPTKTASKPTAPPKQMAPPPAVKQPTPTPQTQQVPQSSGGSMLGGLGTTIIGSAVGSAIGHTGMLIVILKT